MNRSADGSAIPLSFLTPMELIKQILRQWHFESWKWLLPYAFVLSIVVFFGSIVAVSILLVRLPEDYLNQDERIDRANRWTARHVIQVTLRTLLGVVLILLGLVMLVTPGQGLLTILVGLTLIDFPGKRYVIRHFLARPRVLQAINRLRARSNHPPLQPVQTRSEKQIY